MSAEEPASGSDPEKRAEKPGLLVLPKKKAVKKRASKSISKMFDNTEEQEEEDEEPVSPISASMVKRLQQNAAEMRAETPDKPAQPGQPTFPQSTNAGLPSSATSSGSAKRSHPGGHDNNPLSALAATLKAKNKFKKAGKAGHLRTAASQGFETPEDKSRLMENIMRFVDRYWRILFVTAVLSSTLSFCIDQFTFATGQWRAQFTTVDNMGGLVGIVVFNVLMVVAARLLVRTTLEAEGSGFPEMKAMLFGHILDNYLNLRVLCVKAVGLAMVVGAGLPIGKEGPNCHMAACIARSMDPEYIKKREQSATGQAQISKLLLAAVAVGVGASFSAPIGGVIFALELMLPQVYDYTAYIGCFTASVIGSLVYEVERSWFAGATGLLPLMSTNVLPGEGSKTNYPLILILLQVTLGAICGFLGGYWIKMHAYVASEFKKWRLKNPAPTRKKLQASSGTEEGLLSGTPSLRRGWSVELMSEKAGDVGHGIRYFQWRDLALCAVVTIINTVWSAYLPLLNGKPQPALLSLLFDKNLMADAGAYAVWPWGVFGTMLLCLAMKWCCTIMALSLPTPTGVVAPTMIIGALIGRCFVMLIPDWAQEALIATDGGPVTDELKGAFAARFAIIGAAAFCAAVCRAFAMAITVFEVLALPNAVLPLCSSTLMAIFVANKVELPFFDKNLAGRGLGGIPAMTFGEAADAPAFSIMKRINVDRDCLSHKCRLLEMHELLRRHKDCEYFPIIRFLEEGEGILMGCIDRKGIHKILDMLDPSGTSPGTMIDLMDPELQRPSDGGTPLVEGCPPTAKPSTTAKEVYLMMKVAHGENIIYVTREGALLGEITFASLMTQKVS